MKSHDIQLLQRVLTDVGALCHASTTRDFNTITRRVDTEGLSFLTITLPTFAKDFERSLELGRVDSSLFVSFKKRLRLPAFLQGFTSQVFDPLTGFLRCTPSVDAIQSVRQVCYLFSKLNLPCSPERDKKAFSNYVQCELTLQDNPFDPSGPLAERYRRIGDILFRDVFRSWDIAISDGKVVPKHGPGSTADRSLGNEKYIRKVWTNRLEGLFPAREFLYSSDRHYFNAIEDDDGPAWLDPGAEPPVRVISVPKTQKTPRIIAMEPTHMQYVQQGLMEMMIETLEDDNILKHFIGFGDQSVNRDMACLGSADKSLATLDLSEASDRVSLQLVGLLTNRHGPLNEAVMACRSTTAEVPGHGVIPLSKYASMGSALTFPIEAMVFLTIVFCGIEQDYKTQLSKKLIYELVGKVRVYGDDIIVPTEHACSVVSALEAFGLKVNTSKSFWSGNFRESCGGDYYLGHDITVVRSRRLLPTQHKQVQEIVSAVSLRNQLYMAGFWGAADFLDGILGELILLPNVQETSPVLGRHSHLGYSSERVCPNLQRDLVRGHAVVSLSPKSHLGDRDALLKYFLKRGEQPHAKDHLRRAGRPQAVGIKSGWFPPY